MSVAIVQELHATGGSSPLDDTLSTFTVGNLILAFAGEDSSGSVAAPTVNGNAMDPVPDASNSFGVDTCGWFYRFAQSGDGAVVRETISGSAQLAEEVYELSGAGVPNGVTSQTTASATSLASQSITGTDQGMVFAGFYMNGLPGASPNPSYNNGFTNDLAATNIRLQSAHKAGTGVSESTTLTIQNSRQIMSAIINVPPALAYPVDLLEEC